MFITKPFRESHADLFESVPFFADHFNQSLPLLILLGKSDQCAVHMLDGRILFIGGYAVAAPGVAELFLFPSIYAAQYPKTFYKQAKWWVNHLKMQFRRVQCWGEDTELSKRWLTRLGFVLEGTLRNYSTAGNSTIWGIV